MVERLFIVLAPVAKNLFIPRAHRAIGLDYYRLPSWDVSSGNHSDSLECRANLAPISVCFHFSGDFVQEGVFVMSCHPLEFSLK